MNFGRVKKEFTSPSVDSNDTYNGHSFKFNVGQFTNERANDTDEKNVDSLILNVLETIPYHTTSGTLGNINNEEFG
jgi:hypothetical protein